MRHGPLHWAQKNVPGVGCELGLCDRRAGLGRCGRTRQSELVVQLRAERLVGGARYQMFKRMQR